MAEMTEKMQEIAEVTKTETVAVRIITVLTLVYLPSSFVTVSVCISQSLSVFASRATYLLLQLFRLYSEQPY
jgi:hypothetical protein